MIPPYLRRRRYRYALTQRSVAILNHLREQTGATVDEIVDAAVRRVEPHTVLGVIDEDVQDVIEWRREG